MRAGVRLGDSGLASPCAGSLSGEPSPCECCIEVYVCGLFMLMSEPERDGGSIDAFLNQVHCHSMPQPVDSNALLFKRRTYLASRTTMFAQDVLNAVNGESPSSSVAETERVNDFETPGVKRLESERV
jgi:hypothetical protein